MEVKTSVVIIPSHPQYLPKHVSLISQGGGSKVEGSVEAEHFNFLYLIIPKLTIEDDVARK